MQGIHAEDLILVAIVKSPRDLEIARLLGWYRIPVATAPKTIRADWLALYQPASFGEGRWRVEYVAPIRGFEMATRGELMRHEPDHPRAQEPYFKVQLGPLQRLDRPVPSKRWRRFTFLYTTGALLLNAQDLSELSLPACEERAMLWRMLKERNEGESVR
jgi:hypothetical protein